MHYKIYLDLYCPNQAVRVMALNLESIRYRVLKSDLLLCYKNVPSFLNIPRSEVDLGFEFCDI